MPNKIKQYRPGSIEVGDAPEVVEFNTVEELLTIPWIAHFKSGNNFHKFSQDTEQMLLMAEYDQGNRWFVIGALAEVVDLPEWR